jgi:tetratricopeptide (TPR) repeat protein
MKLFRMASYMISLIIILLMSTIPAYCQDKEEYEFVSLAQDQKIVLSSQLRFGGTTRSTVYIKLPANTVQWGYMLTTKKSSAPGSLNLLTQLVNLFDRTHLIAPLFTQLTCPGGESTVNAYLLAQKDYANFINDGSFNYFAPATRKAFNSGPVKVESPLCIGEYYIGIENPAATAAVTVMLDAVAIVRKPQPPKPTPLQELLTNIVNNANKPKDSATIRSEAARDSVTRAERSAINYGNLGWSAYERGDITMSIQHSLKSISIHPMFYAKANLGLCYLVQGKDDLALDAYMTGLDLLQNESGKRSSLKGAISELEKAKAKGGLSGTADDILNMLRGKL